MKTAQEHNSPVRLIETTVQVNDTRKRAMARKVAEACGGDLRGKTVAVLGLTFKPNTDDMREAPSLTIIQALQDRGARVRAFDPQGMIAAAALTEGVHFTADAYDAATGAEALVIVTDLSRIKTLLAKPVIVDLRNIYRPAEMETLGFDYFSVGRPAG